MSGQESRTAYPAASQPDQLPGAYPGTPENSEDAQVSSDLNSLSRAVKARRAEYIRKKKIRVRVGSWNIAALPGTEEDIGRWFAQGEHTPGGVIYENDGGQIDEQDRNVTGSAEDSQAAAGSLSSDKEHIDIYVLGLQEIIDLSSPSEALRPYVDPAPSIKWKEAVQNALPEGYKLVSSQQLMGLLLLVYAAPSIAPTISSVSSSSVGTGLMGYMGNKGAIATRIVIGGTTRVVFLNCHMAAGADKASFDRRNWDAGQIILRTKFDPLEEDDDISEEPSISLGQEDFAFWFGDLNYRLEDIPGDDVRRLLHLHTENAFRLPPKPSGADKENAPPSDDDANSRPSLDSEPSADGNIALEDNDIEPLQDPTSLETTLASLLPHDQLLSLQKKQKAFHEGWREGPINFLPTYKYDIGRIGVFDSSEKQRSPSWCDRILYRTKHDYSEYVRRTKEAEEAKKRDEEMRNLGLDKEAEDDSVLFDYDPESDGVQDSGEYDENEDSANGIDNTALTQGICAEDAIEMISYKSHQNIASSDHKPLHADFVLICDAVDPELKAKVHQEVVRELDRVENEARPDITLVVDRPLRKSTEDRMPNNGANDPDAVDFGQVKYDVPVARGLTLANTGRVTATFSFRHRPNDDGNEADSLAPSWLDVRVDWPPDRDDPGRNIPKEYTLPPGESVQVQLTLCVHDIDIVRDLNRGKADIEDILVLRVINGRDQFISVSGQWLPTCFGFSLSELTRIPDGGIRQLDKMQLSQLNEGGENSGSRTSAPRELFRLTEAITDLTERSVAEWGMVGEDSESEICPWMSERTGWPFDPETWAHPRNHDRYKLLSLVREAIDTGVSFSSLLPPELPARHRVELLSETLLSFLHSLDDGLITQQLWSQLEQQILTHEKDKRILTPEQSQSWVLETLSSSPAHSVSFTFLTFMLNRVANEIAPVTAPAMSPPLSPAQSVPRRSTSLSMSSIPPSEPLTTPSSPTPSTTSTTASALPFPFRFKSRSRGFSGNGNGSSEGDSTPVTSAPTPALNRRQAVNKAFAKIFAEAIFLSRIVRPEKEKERRAWEERKRSVLEPFLSVDGV